MTPLSVDGLLLDLDGTLYVGDAPLPGAIAAVSSLVEAGIRRRYLTNTTRISRQALARRLRQMGFPIEMEEIFTAPVAAASWLSDRGLSRVTLYLPDAARQDFPGMEVVEEGAEGAEAIIVGDLGNGWSFARMNRAFLQLLGGSKLVALQKNRYWKTAEGLALDAGPFVAALEFAAGVEAVVVGKPSADFFRLAAASLRVDPSRIMVVGDDVETDVGGAQGAGMRGALVRTGKFREDLLARSGVRPDLIADSVGEAVAAALSV